MRSIVFAGSLALAFAASGTSSASDLDQMVDGFRAVVSGAETCGMQSQEENLLFRHYAVALLLSDIYLATIKSAFDEAIRIYQLEPKSKGNTLSNFHIALCKQLREMHEAAPQLVDPFVETMPPADQVLFNNMFKY